MKNSLFLIVLTILFNSCTTITKLSNEAIHFAIVGQNEIVVYKRLGVPAKVIQTPDGGRKLIYELHSRGTPATLNKSKLTFNYSGDMGTPEPHLSWKYSSVNTETNSPEYTIYSGDTSVLEVFLNSAGECVRFLHNLNRSQLEQFYESFKKYVPKDDLL
ncbi:hypothetical protein GM418_25435 [Maribellus comscasis]|uniref:Uncharacterized protein n=1 Tax=Maribellus comscasis TaxID=2681766 RepID=A0A6I6JZX9_9BACT|nr:hypothetical protein [Maribellus comscasis]QGY46879.1 hypothetical protein GM418_25435 [Maribellus comscasis]